MFELFEAWLSLMGDQAQPEQIEKALQERGNNDALKKFKDWMRNPPLMPIQPVQHSKPLNKNGKQYQMALHKQYSFDKVKEHNHNMHSETSVMALHDIISYNNESQSFSQCSAASNFSIRPLNQNEQTTQLSLQRESSYKKCHSGISQSSSRSSYSGGKRSHSELNCLSTDDEDIPKKSRKCESVSLLTPKRPPRRRKKANMNALKCEELVQRKNIDEKFIIELIKKLLLSDSHVLTADQFYLFLHHTVTLVIEKTGVSEDTVLSVLISDFKNIYEHISQRGHATFLLDNEHCSLSLGEKEWEYLKLYTEHARSRVVTRFREENCAFVTSKYLFIDYAGEPVVANVKDGPQTKTSIRQKDPKSIAEITTENNELICISDDENPITNTGKVHNCLRMSNLNEMEEETPDKTRVSLAKGNISLNEVNPANERAYNHEQSDMSYNKITEEHITSVSLNIIEKAELVENKSIEDFNSDQNVMGCDRENAKTGPSCNAVLTRDQLTIQETNTDRIDSLIEDISNVIENLSNSKEEQIMDTPENVIAESLEIQCAGAHYVDC